jgi:hypothetical protein
MSSVVVLSVGPHALPKVCVGIERKPRAERRERRAERREQRDAESRK